MALSRLRANEMLNLLNIYISLALCNLRHIHTYNSDKGSLILLVYIYDLIFESI